MPGLTIPDFTQTPESTHHHGSWGTRHSTRHAVFTARHNNWGYLLTIHPGTAHITATDITRGTTGLHLRNHYTTTNINDAINWVNDHLHAHTDPAAAG